MGCPMRGLSQQDLPASSAPGTALGRRSKQQYCRQGLPPFFGVPCQTQRQQVDGSWREPCRPRRQWLAAIPLHARLIDIPSAHEH